MVSDFEATRNRFFTRESGIARAKALGLEALPGGMLYNAEAIWRILGEAPSFECEKKVFLRIYLPDKQDTPDIILKDMIMMLEAQMTLRLRGEQPCWTTLEHIMDRAKRALK